MIHPLCRAPRFFFAGLLLLLVLLAAGIAAPRAQEDWFRTGTGLGVEKLRLALPDFRAPRIGANPLAETFNRTLWNDLAYSGIVELVSKSFYPLTQPASPHELRPDKWTSPPVGAHMVVFGHLSADNQNASVGAWVHDVGNPRAPAVLAKRYRGEPTEAGIRQLAHELADDIVVRLSGGLPAIAQSRIAFVSARTRNKEIWLMDYDGYNQTRLTYHNSICLAPRWSPDNSRIALTSYLHGKPDIYVHSLVTNKRITFPTYPNTTTTLAWSPDGRQVAFSSSHTGNQEIYVANSDGSDLRRLTYSSAVDISPRGIPRPAGRLPSSPTAEAARRSI